MACRENQPIQPGDIVRVGNLWAHVFYGGVGRVIMLEGTFEGRREFAVFNGSEADWRRMSTTARSERTWYIFEDAMTLVERET